MSETEEVGAGAPWRTLWLRPGNTIEQIVARESEARTLMLAAIVAAVEGFFSSAAHWAF